MAPATAGAVLFEARHAAVSPRGATRKAGTFQLVLRLRFHGTAMSAAARRAPPAELTHRTRMIRALVAIATGTGQPIMRNPIGNGCRVYSEQFQIPMST